MQVLSIKSKATTIDGSKPSATFNKQLFQTKGKDVFFKGQQYPSGNYTDEDIKFAKNYLGQEDWEKEVYKQERDKLPEPSDAYMIFHAFTFFILTIPGSIKEEIKIKKIAESRIRNIRNLMVDLNNEKLLDAEKKKAEKAKLILKETIDFIVKNELKLKFLDRVKSGNDKIIPTAVMLEGNTKDSRLAMLGWIKEHASGRVIEFTHEREDDTIARLEQELEYAQERFSNSGQRTILHINNFSDILDEKKTRPEGIADMKNMLYDISKKAEPITIIFETDDSSNLVDAFTGNHTRIPLKIKMDKSILSIK